MAECSISLTSAGFIPMNHAGSIALGNLLSSVETIELLRHFALGDRSRVDYKTYVELSSKANG